jgi:endonuclease YncB( thermonuclease family)
MFFMLADEIGIDLTPILNWVSLAFFILVFLTFAKGFRKSYKNGSHGNQTKTAVRQARNGRVDNKHLPAPFRIKNAYVIDGDTLSRGEWRIRIYGMDAPESDQPGGDEATARMKELVEGKTLHILPKDVDIYGRLVARVRCGAYDVGEEMVKSGHAVATSDFTRAYTNMEHTARRGRKGLWEKGRIDDPKAWRNSKDPKNHV